jgi:hypothetical protein
MTQDLWTFLHVLTFVYWLGADLGVFYSSRFVVNADYTPETRAVALKILAWLDMAPRYALLLTLPVGLQLAHGAELSAIGGGWLLLAWLGSAAWISLVITIHRREGTAAGRRLGQIDLGLRFVLIAGLVVAAVLSFTGGAPFAADWLALKALLFALAVTMGVGIRVTFAPFGPAFARLMTEGSSAEVEERMSTALARAKPFVLVLWAIIAAAAFIGISQPGF